MSDEKTATVKGSQNGRLFCGCFGRCPGNAHHAAEAARIRGVLGQLGAEFAEDGPVRTILRERVADELRRAACAR